MTIKVTNQVNSYDTPAKASMRVLSHWNDNNMVVLVVDEKEITVSAKDIIAAINNATNTARF